MTWFNPHIIRYLSDEASKLRGRFIFEQLGYTNVEYTETQRSGQDLRCDAVDAVLEPFKQFKPVSNGKLSFELTMRFSFTSFWEISWRGQKAYNVMERRLENNHGKVEIFSGLVDLVWMAREMPEDFYRRMFTDSERKLNNNLGPKFEELSENDERRVLIEALVQEDFQTWKDEGAKAVLFTYDDIVNKENVKDKTLTASITGSHSTVYQVPASKRIRISLVSGVFKIKSN